MFLEVIQTRVGIELLGQLKIPEKYKKFRKILGKSGKIPVRPEKRSSLNFGSKTLKNTQNLEKYYGNPENK